MIFKNLKIYNNTNKKYSLVKIASGLITPFILISSLSGCLQKEPKNQSVPNYDDYHNNYNYYDNIDESTSSSNEDLITHNLDAYSLGIINSKISIDSNLINTFINYLKSINVSYEYSDLYNTNFMLEQYESLKPYLSTSSSLFENNNISKETIYKIVKQNNVNDKIAEVATMTDSELEEVCSIVAEVLNDYVKQNPTVNLNLLSEKIRVLNILKFDDFSNGYYDSLKHKMGFNISYLKSKSNDFFRKTVEHETYHLIQSSSIGENKQKNIEKRMGFSYKFYNAKVNSLLWNWYYEGAAEYLTCNRNHSQESEVYSAIIKSMDTIKASTLLSPNNMINTFENMSCESDLDALFNYYGCTNKEDKLEVLNLMYSYNIIFNLNFSSDDFYKEYKNIYGSSASKIKIEKELNNSIAQTLTKYFYRDLSLLIKEKEITIEEVFSLISIFENEISREIWYNSNQQTLVTFFEVYNNIQSNFFNMISYKINLPVADIQQVYNVYNKVINVDISKNSLIDSDKKDFYRYILETRKNDKMNSINYVSEKYNSKKR